MASALPPHFSFRWDLSKTHELEWNDISFNKFTEELSDNWKAQEFYLASSEDRKCYYLYPMSDAFSKLNNVIVTFHHSESAKNQIKRLFERDRQCHQQIQRSKSLPVDMPNDCQEIFRISEIWTHIWGKSPLLVFDFDYTFAYDFTRNLGTNTLVDISLIEKDLNLQLQSGMKSHPNMTFILMSNTHVSVFPMKIRLSQLDTSLFADVLPSTGDLHKSPRFESFLRYYRKRV